MASLLICPCPLLQTNLKTAEPHFPHPDKMSRPRTLKRYVNSIISSHETFSFCLFTQETGLVNKLQAERYQCNQCPQVLKDLKSLQIHQFVDHHHDANAGNSPRLIAPPPAPVQAPPPVQHYRQHVPVQPQPTRSFPPPNPPHFTNGLIGSREGSISSDSGEGGPVSPVLRCELCGLSNFSSTKALQQVNIIRFCLKLDQND